MLKTSDDLVLPAAVSGARHDLAGRSGYLSFYASDIAPVDGQQAPPLLLIHSINAAGSAYEVRPIYEHYRATRVVYALDLPGFGFSARARRRYTPQLMTQAIHDMVKEISLRHGNVPIDAMALSLSSEFLARAATEQPKAFRSLALVSPTGFDRRAPFYDLPGSTRGKPWLYAALNAGGGAMFRLLTSRPIIRHYLRKTWGSDQIDEGLLDYDYLTTHQPGAEHAPFDFVSGYLLSSDSTTIYERLAVPVWASHGIRGDFVDYSNMGLVRRRPNWSITVFPTGALPHFEIIDEFTSAFDTFLSRIDPV
jgi:pimeloyl-ACP methyl ester carboxylesterase